MAGITKFLKKVCVQDALYWAPTNLDGYGRMQYEPPKLVKCRWDDVSEIISEHIYLNNGQWVVCHAEVLVLEDLDVEGVLYLGNFTGITNEHRVKPLTLRKAYTIQKFDKIPLFRSKTEFVRKAYL